MANDFDDYEGNGVYQVRDTLEPNSSVLERARYGVVSDQDRIKVQSGMVQSYREMLEQKRLPHQEIDGILKENKSFKCLVTTNARIYVVEPEPRTSGARCYTRVSAILRRFLDDQNYKNAVIKVYKVSETVFDSYEAARVTAGNTGAVLGVENRKLSILFETAIREKASDIHFRVRNDRTVVLFRINKLLVTKEVLEKDVGTRLVSAMFATGQSSGSTKDFNKKEVIDTSFTWPPGSGNHMVRVNSTPEERGVTVVARIRDSKQLLPLEQAGYEPQQLKALKVATTKHQGLMLFVGPTNSGKSTTLTTIISEISPEFAVCEVADPIEVVLPNVSHFPVPNDDDEQLERVMKAMVRQDPDVLVVGEIRSKTTASAASTISYAGKLVFSTVHAPSIGGAFPRLLKFGMELDDLQAPDFLNGMTAQKLVPIICKVCRQDKMQDPTLTERENIERQFHFDKIFKGERLYYRNFRGCSACGNTGVSGITLAAEVISMDSHVRGLVSQRKWHEIEPWMQEAGIFTMHAHAAKKTLDGIFDPSMVEVQLDPFTDRHIESALKAIEMGKATNA